MDGKTNAVVVSVILKVGLAMALGATIFAGVLVRPPRRTFPRADLRVVVLAAFGLYALGLGASLSHHVTVAMAVYATGIAFSTFAVWLSRGRDSWEPPRGDDPGDPPPPGGPDDPVDFDWPEFERQLNDYLASRDRPLTPA